MIARLREERGSALMAAFWMLVVLLLAGLAASYVTNTEVKLSGNERLDTQLFYLAEAGVAEVKKHLDGIGTPFDGTGPQRSAPRQLFLNAPVGVPGVEGLFTAYVDKQDHLGGKPTKYLAITVRAWIPGYSGAKVIQEMVGQDNFAKYAYFTNEEKLPSGTNVWFTSNDILRGPVHTNGQFNINGDPIFLKPVTTSAADINYATGTHNPDFRQGITFDVEHIQLPTDTSLIRVKAQDPEGLYFNGNAEIEMIWDAVSDFGYLEVTMGGMPTIYQIPENGVLYVNGVCRIKGVLKGQMTVASSGDMYIDDNILYTTDPRVDPDSNDLLGLVSDGNIYMAATTENLDAGDETVMAVIMALGTSFTAENYASGSPRGYLRVIGGIIQDRRGAVGTFSSSTGALLTGYNKDYVYDGRLADSPPPAFPTTGRILTLAWREMDPGFDISINVF